MGTKGKILAVLAVVILIILGVSSSMLFENVGAEEILVIQAPVSGKLSTYISPGLKWQGFGKPTKYRKASQLDCVVFPETEKDKGRHEIVDVDNPLPVVPIRFNDAGKGWMAFSDRWEMPLEHDNIIKLHTKFGSQAAVERDLVLRTFERAIYMTGPLFSSRESYAEKRPDLLSSIEDQAMNGIYKTTVRTEKRPDPLTGQEKTIDITERVSDPSAPMGFGRVTESPLREFGVVLIAGQLTINRLEYSEQVMAQIDAQQNAIMKVQTAIAEAKEAEQKAITVAEQGKANAATAKWEQEVIKAKAVTEAEQKREVAKLAKEAAEFTKQEQILLGEGEAERKRLVLNADGALAQKLATYEAVMDKATKNLATYNGNWVPTIVMDKNGATSTSGASSAATLIDLLMAKTAKDLSLDMSVPKGKTVSN